jgi:hypothetical protein
MATDWNGTSMLSVTKARLLLNVNANVISLFGWHGPAKPKKYRAMRHSTALLQEEVIMATHTTRHYFGRHDSRSVAKVVFPLLGLGAVGYIVIAMAIHAPPSLSAASRYAPESRIINPAPETAGAQATAGVVSAAEPTAYTPQPDIDYFPNRYVNQATRIEDPIATF